MERIRSAYSARLTMRENRIILYGDLERKQLSGGRAGSGKTKEVYRRMAQNGRDRPRARGDGARGDGPFVQSAAPGFPVLRRI